MLAPSGGGLILYQAYGNLYAMTGRKAYLLKDKQIPSVGIFDEKLETASQITRDAVTTHLKTALQDLKTTSEDENPIHTLGDYFKPSHKGYRNTIELPVGNNVVPLQSDTIRLVQNGCSFHKLQSEDLNQHLKDFLKLVDSFDLDGDNRERTHLRLFQFSFRDQASNWIERLPAGSITT
ncbi:hypothetical protein Tco_1352675 [Tanacetum coccineum]